MALSLAWRGQGSVLPDPHLASSPHHSLGGTQSPGASWILGLLKVLQLLAEWPRL